MDSPLWLHILGFVCTFTLSPSSRYVNSQLEPQLNEYRQLSQAMAQAKEQYKQVIATTENYCWSNNYAWDWFPLTNHRAPLKNCQCKSHDTNIPCQSVEKVNGRSPLTTLTPKTTTRHSPTCSQPFPKGERRCDGEIPFTRPAHGHPRVGQVWDGGERWTASWAELSS